MSSSTDVDAKPRSSGTYVATDMSNRLQIGQEHFQIRETDGGFNLQFSTVPYGSPSPPQRVVWDFDSDWDPIHLTAAVEGLATTEVTFEDTKCEVETRHQSGVQSQRFDVGRQNAFFLLNGALCAPLIIARKFDWDAGGTQSHALIPPGFLDVRRLPDDEVDGEPRSVLEVRLATMGVHDVVTLFVDARRDVVRYQTRNFQLLVELEEDMQC